MFIGDCPRCGQSQTTFDILADTYSGREDLWDPRESFLRCRSCGKPSIALLTKICLGQQSPATFHGLFVNRFYSLAEWVFEIPGQRAVPEHVPPHIQAIFQEAAKCAAIGCWDAAGTMFRKTLDAATRSLIPPPDADNGEERAPNWKVYKDLRLRLDWLFAHGKLDRSLEDLSSCIHLDGNDAAHDDAGIGRDEAEDLGDFIERILEIIYTLPGQIEDNRKRREERRTRKA